MMRAGERKVEGRYGRYYPGDTSVTLRRSSHDQWMATRKNPKSKKWMRQYLLTNSENRVKHVVKAS